MIGLKNVKILRMFFEHTSDWETKKGTHINFIPLNKIILIIMRESSCCFTFEFGKQSVAKRHFGT